MTKDNGNQLIHYRAFFDECTDLNDLERNKIPALLGEVKDSRLTTFKFEGARRYTGLAYFIHSEELAAIFRVGSNGGNYIIDEDSKSGYKEYCLIITIESNSEKLDTLEAELAKINLKQYDPRELIR